MWGSCSLEWLSSSCSNLSYYILFIVKVVEKDVNKLKDSEWFQYLTRLSLELCELIFYRKFPSLLNVICFPVFGFPVYSSLHEHLSGCLYFFLESDKKNSSYFFLLKYLLYLYIARVVSVLPEEARHVRENIVVYKFI